MTASKAYLDTTVFTDALLKRDSRGDSARAALKRYSQTILPVYAIKEFKAGPLQYFVYLHNKLLTTKSVAATLAALSAIGRSQPNRSQTAGTALSNLMRAFGDMALTDTQAADTYRSAIARIIISSWRKRRKITSKVSEELTCYSEADPVIAIRTGLFENPGVNCALYGTQECCLAIGLKGRGKDLDALVKAIQGQNRREDDNRRGVLRKLLNTPKRPMDAGDCRKLGDAYFALHAPSDAVILTTNLKDHARLANALGKRVEAP